MFYLGIIYMGVWIMLKYSSFKKWEVVGFFWIVILGSLLHFTFELSGGSKLVALFSPVNESVWEHLKLGYFSLTFFMIIKYFFIKNKVHNFFIANFMGIISMSIFIIVVFYSYEAITGSHNLMVDIGSFVLGALLCQIISYNIMTKNIRVSDSFGLIMFILMGLSFMFFTFYPLHIPLFMDSRGFYGIK